MSLISLGFPLLRLFLLGMQQGAKHLIHEDCVMSVVCLVVCVMDRMVLGAKDRPDLPMDVVVDVGSPDAGGK